MNSFTGFEKVFSGDRMKRYMASHRDTDFAILHYGCNIQLSESFYPCLSVFEVALRNALNRELVAFFERDDWYTQLLHTPGLSNLNKYITQANQQIAKRREFVSTPKIIAELTLGFWVSLLNSEYEKILWKDLRRAFPYMPKNKRVRKNIAAKLNKFRHFRNRIFHNESICWNMEKIREIHQEMLLVLSWINKDIPQWLSEFDRVDNVVDDICKKMGWD